MERIMFGSNHTEAINRPKAPPRANPTPDDITALIGHDSKAAWNCNQDHRREGGFFYFRKGVIKIKVFFNHCGLVYIEA